MDVRSIGKYRIVGKGANGSPNRKGNSSENRGVFAAIPEEEGGVNKSDLPQIKTCSCDVEHVIKSLEQLFCHVENANVGLPKKNDFVAYGREATKVHAVKVTCEK